MYINLNNHEILFEKREIKMKKHKHVNSWITAMYLILNIKYVLDN